MRYRPSTPVEARDIAQHATHYMTMILDCRSLADLTKAWAAWKLYADSSGVCWQIREHMSQTYAQVAGSIKDTRVVRDPTGEQAA